MSGTAAEKIRIVGRVGYIACRILLVLLAIAMVGVLVSVGVIAKLPEGFAFSMEGDAAVRLTFPETQDPLIGQQVEGEWEFSFSGLTVLLDHRVRDEEGILFTGRMGLAPIDKGELLRFILLGGLILAATGFLVWELGRLCRDFRDCSSPFCPEITDRLGKVLRVFVGWFLLEKICAALIGGMLLGEGISFNGEDIAILLVAALLFLLRLVLFYGISLEENRKQEEENT